MQKLRSKRASLWQSALDEVTAGSTGGAAAFGGAAPKVVKRPVDEDLATNEEVVKAIEELEFEGKKLPEPPAPSPAAGVADVAKFCSTTAFRLAEARLKSVFTGDDTEVQKLQQQLGEKFGLCDAKWTEAIKTYVRTHLGNQSIPYRPYNDIGDYVIENRLPGDALVAMLADWGTGEDGAKKMLQHIAKSKPDVVMHLGDVYYSGTEHEFQNYFYGVWQQTLGLPKLKWNTKPPAPTKPATFTLSGNHDMYAGGGPYYTTIDMLGQPASYFCLRNQHWQFIALDTGLHDSNPTKGGATFLEDSEVEWLQDRIATKGNRKTVLLSHHQLFTGFNEEEIEGKSVNEKLFDQVKSVLPQVTLWLWGHEHNLVVFQKHLGVLGRCIGHAAFPVATSEKQTRNDVPVAATLTPDPAQAFFPHGYALIKLNGQNAKARYMTYDPATDKATEIFSEDL